MRGECGWTEGPAPYAVRASILHVNPSLSGRLRDERINEQLAPGYDDICWCRARRQTPS
jgi:hypothetical protein